jgi:predicted esterase/LysM repeat protein
VVGIVVVRLSVWIVGLLAMSLSLTAASSDAKEQVHLVGEGHTLGRIAKRYNVSIEAICTANRIRRTDAIRPGQKLVIPDKADKDGSRARRRVRGAPEPATARAQQSGAEADSQAKPDRDGMQRIHVSGSGSAYYFEPIGPGRLSLRPVIVYMHGRGGQPQADCRRWARVARPLGWLVCPSGPGAQGDGRGWNNNWISARRAAVGAIEALRSKYGRRVQLYGNTIVGFSEGAFVAMNVGVREPRTFNRWLILAGKESYWGGSGLEELQSAKARIRRVYLITGQKDEVVEGTQKVRDWLRKYGVPTRITTPRGIGHQVALETRPELYRMALIWLQEGSSASKRVATAEGPGPG